MPPGNPGSPSEVQLQSYSNAPASAAMLAFGSLGVTAGKLVVNGFLFDTKNLQYPQVLAKQYSEEASDDSARQVAHRFADEIIYRLGGGVAGIAESKIYYVKVLGTGVRRSGLWTMMAPTSTPSPILEPSLFRPRISPDNTRLAFASFGKYGAQLKMYSLCSTDILTFPAATSAPSLPPGRPVATNWPTQPRPTAPF